MKELSAEEIDTLLRRVGSHTLIALATDSTTRVSPIDWANGSKQPDDAQMERLVVIKEVMDTVTASHGQRTAREWLIQSNCYGDTHSPAEAIRRGDYSEARRSARCIDRRDFD